MCGLTGFYSPLPLNDSHRIALNMINALAHRGPDDVGVWSDEDFRLTLGHRRLSIIDLSQAGHQPMRSACDRYIIVFNGEIYNHLALREQLLDDDKTPVWRGHSDTETLLACFAAWGIEKTLQAATGMFALALWDRKSKVLTLARDRLGEKPLYWGWQDDTLLFGSELKALKAHPACKRQIDRNSLALLLRHGFIASPYSIYEGIEKLRAGHFINIPLANLAGAKSASSVAYWAMNNVIADGQSHLFTGTDEQATDVLEQQLSHSIGAQMLADVPLGAFLSGGIDSSTIVALMQAQSNRPVRTFTIGFDDKQYNEAVHAQAIAHHLGTQHTELYVQPSDALAIIPRLPEIYDEPFADSSQIPTFLISQLTHQHVTVALSGDGGDELFGGYNTYQFVPQLWEKIDRSPAPLRRLAAAGLSCISSSGWNAALAPLQPMLSDKFKHSITGEKFHKLAEILSSVSKEAFYRQLSSHWKNPEQVVMGAVEPDTLLNEPSAWPQVDSFEHWMMAMSAQTYMIDDILVKVDRASMSNSLEVRVPMLDHRLVELAWTFPLHMKIRNGAGKWLLRQVLYRHVPQALIDRPKKGFSIPLADWLRGPLRNWADSLLNETRLNREGYFNTAQIRKTWQLHLDGERDCATKLWCVLMFQAWLENEKNESSN